MDKKISLFLAILMLTQVASFALDEVPVEIEKGEIFTSDESWEASGRNNSSSGNNSSSDAHCLVLNNLTMNQTYYVSIYLVNTCSDGINYPGINASSDNSGVDGLQEMWWYVIPGANTNSSNLSDYPYYHMNLQLSLNQSIPNGTTITLYFEATVLHCGPNNSWSNDCPNSSDSNLSYQFITPGYTQSVNNTNGNNTSGNNTVGNNTDGNNSGGNNTVGNNTAGNNSTATIPNYYFDNNYGLNFNSVSNIMNGTYVPTTVLIHNYENNSTTTDHMLAVTFYSDGHSEQKITQYVTPPVSRNTISISQYVYITSGTTYVEVSMDVLTCVDEFCDMSKTPEDRYYPADIQYYQSYSSTDIPRVVELSDTLFDVDPNSEEAQLNGIDMPRFTFEMEEIDLNGEMYYRIVVTSCQMDLETHQIFVTAYWADDSGANGYNKWNLTDPNGVYGFYPGNSDSTLTFQDVIDYNGDSVVSTFGVGDTIFIKRDDGNRIINEFHNVQITYAFAPAEDDGISMSAMLYVGGQQPFISDDDNSENNSDSNDTDDDSDSSGLPSIGVIGTLGAIAVGFVAVIRREQEE